jgi:hypothetical protein
MVPSYQPETAYQVFMRALSNKDIATGKVDLTDDYATKGPSSTTHIMNDVISPPEPECYIWEPGTCTKEQWETVANGTAIVRTGSLLELRGFEEAKTGSDDLTNGGSQKILGGGRQ